MDENVESEIIDVTPMGAVRMTKSDTWKLDPNHADPRKRQRDAVRRYFEYKNKVVSSCNECGYCLGETLDIIFYLPMPNSWSKKKKEAHQFKPHQSRPDIDNLLKAFMDALKKEDSDVWKVTAEKRYSYTGFIVIKKENIVV